MLDEDEARSLDEDDEDEDEYEEDLLFLDDDDDDAVPGPPSRESRARGAAFARRFIGFFIHSLFFSPLLLSLSLLVGNWIVVSRSRGGGMTLELGVFDSS